MKFPATLVHSIRRLTLVEMTHTVDGLLSALKDAPLNLTVHESTEAEDFHLLFPRVDLKHPYVELLWQQLIGTNGLEFELSGHHRFVVRTESFQWYKNGTEPVYVLAYQQRIKDRWHNFGVEYFELDNVVGVMTKLLFRLVQPTNQQGVSTNMPHYRAVDTTRDLDRDQIGYLLAEVNPTSFFAWVQLEQVLNIAMLDHRYNDVANDPDIMEVRIEIAKITEKLVPRPSHDENQKLVNRYMAAMAKFFLDKGVAIIWPNGDQLRAERKTGEYILGELGNGYKAVVDHYQVMYLEHQLEDGKSVYMVNQSEFFPVQRPMFAMEAFHNRFYSSQPCRATQFGWSLEEIHEKRNSI